MLQLGGEIREFPKRDFGKREKGGTGEGGELNLKSGMVWGGERVTSSEENYMDITGKSNMEKEKRDKMCCCDRLLEMRMFISFFAVINLVFIATGSLKSKNGGALTPMFAFT